MTRAFIVMNWQLYQGSGQTKSAACRDAVQRAVSNSVQLSDVSIINNMDNMVTDFTQDPPMNAHESLTVQSGIRSTCSTWCLPLYLSTKTHSRSVIGCQN